MRLSRPRPHQHDLHADAVRRGSPLRRLLATILAAALLAALPAAPAQAAFGLKDVDLTFSGEDGSPLSQAGAHPLALHLTLAVNTEPFNGHEIPAADVKDLRIESIPGFVAAPGATPRCASVDFLAPNGGACPRATMIGLTDVTLIDPNNIEHDVPVYNIAPPPGVLMKVGFTVLGVPVSTEIGLSESTPYRGIATVHGIAQLVPFYRADLTLWGTPADPVHDTERGGSANIAETPLLTLPRACTGPLQTVFEADSWQDPDVFDRQLSSPFSSTGCAKLGFGPTIVAQPTTKAAQSPSGLDFSLDVNDPGLLNPKGLAQSDIRKAVVTLPEGMTANPSLAEGLEVCSEVQLAKETAFSAPGAGCPETSKIGSLEVESPLIEESLKGSVYIATPYENEAGSLIALYFVVKNPTLGVVVKQVAKVEPDPETGQLVTSTEFPQLPFSHARLHLREGARSPLISPPSCGPQEAEAELTPWAGGAPLRTTSTFQIITGPGEGPCPPGAPPFHPGFSAGTLNNDAGSYSPVNMRITRKDGDQDITRFSSVLPPGLLAKLAGVGKCSDAAIAAAKARTGPHGGAEELANPSCPADSKIGRTLAGAGVGSQLTYVPGSLYLAGPFGGDPLSVAAIVPAVAGPFDAGTVLVREALTVNPKTGQAEADGAASDPIPHILRGIPLNVRDLRVYVDRPSFTLNPTSCAPMQAKATLFGSNLLPLDPADDVPVSLSDRFQAANCARLGFKPALSLRLKGGGTKRGGHPALRSVVTPRPGDANFGNAVVTLPRSAFLDQAHIRTICTRVQFAAKACPIGSVYGKAKAWSPLLDEPAEGPVYLRSSNHNLPDLVMALHGPPSAPVDVELVGRIDSHKGGIRASFEDIPDVPINRFILEMQGGQKGLIVNSRNLCQRASKASAELTGQNGRQHNFNPLVRAASCKGAATKRRAG